jgi:hypothetical protein
MIHEHDTVVLACELPDLGLKSGDVGTVVLLHPGNGCEVEFMALNGETVAVTSLSTDQLRPIRSREIAHARPIDHLES